MYAVSLTAASPFVVLGYKCVPAHPAGVPAVRKPPVAMDNF